MFTTQTNAEILVGIFSELPSPATMPPGYLYFCTDTKDLYILVQDALTHIRSWQKQTGATDNTVRFSQAMLQTTDIFHPGTGSSSGEFEPMVRVAPDDTVVRVAAQIGILSANLFDTSLRGANVHEGVGLVGGINAIPGDMVYVGNPIFNASDPTRAGNDVDLAINSALNGNGNYTQTIVGGDLGGPNAWPAQSDDNGQTWTALAPITVAGSTFVDRPWLAATGISTVLAYVGFSDDGPWSFRSDVFGGAFAQVSRVLPAGDWRATNDAVAGKMEIDRVNTSGATPGQFWAYIPWGAPFDALSDPTVNDQIFLIVSNDGGASWTPKPVFSAPLGANIPAFPVISIEPNGRIWLAYSDNTNIFVMSSNDHGDTWSTPVLVSTNTNFARVPSIVATDHGVAVLYYGTHNATDPDPAADWEAFFTQNLSGAVNGPWRTPISAVGVIYTGLLCAYGGACPDPNLSDRNMLEVTSLHVDSLGYVHAAFNTNGFYKNPLLPVPPPVTLTGTVTFTNGSASVTGVGTLFVSEVNIGDMIKLSTDPDSAYAEVLSVTDDFNLTLSAVYTGVGGAGNALLVPQAVFQYFFRLAVTYAVQITGPRLGRVN